MKPQKLLFGLALAPMALFAQEAGMAEAVQTAATSANDSLIEIVTQVAPYAVGLVVGIAGVRLVLKLFNRGVGK